MKKSLLIVAIAAVLVMAFAPAAFATSAKTWDYSHDYYSWDTTPGIGRTGTVYNQTLGSLGANPTNPGVHGNYLANTAKCGICHSVHRANAAGVKLLNTATATCAGCHKAGSSTVTKVLVSWQSGGPHSSGTDGSCTNRSCHANNPHGANSSQYKIFASKLITATVDVTIQDALADSAASGISADDLNASVNSTWTQSTRDAVITGYTCNSAGCHEQSMFTVLHKGYSEKRVGKYVEGGTNVEDTFKTGHMTVAASNGTNAFAPVGSCVSCHDQTDGATRTGFTFPHSQTAFGASNVTTTVVDVTSNSRAYLWMTIADSLTGTRTGMFTTDMKAYDGACLKCHRDGLGNGIGETK